MTFTRIDDYHERSGCGLYTVCAYGTSRGWRFEAWFRKEHLAADFMQAESAREHCRVHAAQLARLAA